jgi:hypothetical protein
MEKKSMRQPISYLMALLVGVAMGQGCSRSNDASGAGAGKEQAVEAGNLKAAVVQIGFLDLEQSCECTRRRIEISWAALQAARGDKSGVLLERVHVDSQESLAEPYRRLRANQVIPAIYFLDGEGKLVEMLQGEVSEDAIRKVLK